MSEEFHKTFLDILFGKDLLDKLYNKIKNNVDFKFNFDLLPKNADTVEKIAPFLLQKMKKEQELIKTDKDYYIARDLHDNTIYICFKELLMLDIDMEKNSNNFLEINSLKSHFLDHNDSSYRIYGRKNEINEYCSYHVFCTNKKYEYRNKNTISFMINNFSDFYYNVHSYIRGFCTRLNNKFVNNSKYEFICTINEEFEDYELVELVKLHEELIDKYSQTDICYPKDFLVII